MGLKTNLSANAKFSCGPSPTKYRELLLLFEPVTALNVCSSTLNGSGKLPPKGTTLPLKKEPPAFIPH